MVRPLGPSSSNPGSKVAGESSNVQLPSCIWGWWSKWRLIEELVGNGVVGHVGSHFVDDVFKVVVLHILGGQVLQRLVSQFPKDAISKPDATCLGLDGVVSLAERLTIAGAAALAWAAARAAALPSHAELSS